jgi:hypothetical protein
MNRDRALKVVLVVVGLIFSGLLYPLTMFVRQEPALAMMLSLYVTLGIFLLLAAREPSANRSLIAFTAWSSFAHAALMAVQAFRNLIPRGELVGVAALVIIGATLIMLAPASRAYIASQCVGCILERPDPDPDILVLKQALSRVRGAAISGPKLPGCKFCRRIFTMNFPLGRGL